MKKLFPSYILLFVMCFMFFIFEPITMYSVNIDDLWFDFGMIIFPLIKLFLISFVGLSIFYSIFYYIFCKKLNKDKIYYFLLIFSFIIFIVSYIQGNYLAGNLPDLNGDKIIWSEYSSDSLISFALLLLVCAIMVMFTLKFGYNKVIKGIKYISLIIFAMLSVSLVTTLLTTRTIDVQKKSFVLSSDNINNVSTDKNFFIFLVDAVDSQKFSEILINSKYKDTFDNFTYYPDTMSAYPFTRDSIPFILTGVINENEDEFIDYSTKAYDNSLLFKELDDYNINIYDNELVWNSNKMEIAKNAKNIQAGVDDITFYKQELKYILYKYLPFYLKKYSMIETMNFKRCKKAKNIEIYDCNDLKNYEIIKNNDLIKIKQKYFNFTHIEGGHVPFDIDEDFNSIDNGTYDDKLKATLKIIDAFINRLKENDVYDNSVIIVMSDHGYDYKDGMGRQNPILYIKGIDEHHEMFTSDKPISYFDLIDAYIELLEK